MMDLHRLRDQLDAQGVADALYGIVQGGGQIATPLENAEKALAAGSARGYASSVLASAGIGNDSPNESKRRAAPDQAFFYARSKPLNGGLRGEPAKAALWGVCGMLVLCCGGACKGWVGAC